MFDQVLGLSLILLSLFINACATPTQLKAIVEPIGPQLSEEKAYGAIQYRLLNQPISHEWLIEDEKGNRYQLYVPSNINTEQGLVFEVPPGRTFLVQTIRFHREFYNIKGLRFSSQPAQVEHLGFYRFNLRYGRWNPNQLDHQSLSTKGQKRLFDLFLGHYKLPPSLVR